MREIKFRAWDGQQMRDTFSVQSNGDGVLYSGEIVDWVAMQFTGLKDKQGKEIYEGDVIIVDKNKAVSVRWDDNNAGFGVYNQDGKRLCASVAWDHWEIIGNIYEHPHLLNSTPNAEVCDATDDASSTGDDK